MLASLKRPSINNTRNSPPPILRRGVLRKRHESETDSRNDLSDTPTKITPIKQLPFSPSQFFNSPDLSFDVTLSHSTPVQGTPRKERNREVESSPLTTPKPLPIVRNSVTHDKEIAGTPKSKRIGESSTPKTPTPFKRAMAELERKSGALKYTPQTPTHVVEDLADIIKKEQEDSSMSESHYEGDYSTDNAFHQVSIIKFDVILYNRCF